MPKKQCMYLHMNWHCSKNCSQSSEFQPKADQDLIGSPGSRSGWFWEVWTGANPPSTVQTNSLEKERRLPVISGFRAGVRDLLAGSVTVLLVVCLSGLWRPYRQHGGIWRMRGWRWGNLDLCRVGAVQSGGASRGVGGAVARVLGRLV